MVNPERIQPKDEESKQYSFESLALEIVRMFESTSFYIPLGFNRGHGRGGGRSSLGADGVQVCASGAAHPSL